MQMSRPGRRSTLWAGVLFAGLILGSGADAGPLHVRQSQPKAAAIIHGRHAEYVIHFDGLVDHRTSRIDIRQGRRVVQSLPAVVNSAPDVLFAAGETPPPGQYVLHWEVRSAADGTVSTGDIPFSVAP
ncbi:MAG TPA: copper resistance protein CopC [Rhodopila sp.]|uniref:copper resistance protein CopC n=1 Tax=Rhodopila sp. TaxID=2480087 RepID=UPI002C68CE64|nr:copper resistance protein CopC [Rhodopila sp.]HVY16180.1 copper resistance protein CopC [Rhodopila sp.]